MSTRNHINVAMALVAAAAIAAVLTQSASSWADSGSTGPAGDAVQVTVPSQLAGLQEPGSTGYVPLATGGHTSRATVIAPQNAGAAPQNLQGLTGSNPAALPQYREPGSTGFVDSGATPKVDPLAVSYLTGRGLSPSEVQAWTVGACSHALRPAWCDAMLNRPSAEGGAAQLITRSVSFRWADAAVGAGFTVGVLLLLAAAVAARHTRRRRVVQTPAR